MTESAAAGIAVPAPSAARYELLADDAIVRDTTTRLEWTRANVSDERLTWSEAAKACAALELDGGRWRLPTRTELLTLVDDTRFDPAIDPIFTCKSGWYWTSTPYAPSPGGCAWDVYFYNGGANCLGRDARGFVRAVRASQ